MNHHGPRRGIVLLFLVAAISCLVFAARPAHAQASAGEQAQQAKPLAPRDVVTYTLPPEKYEKAVRLSRTEYTLYAVRFFYGLLILGAVLAWRIGPKFRDWSERATSRRWLQTLLFAALLLLTLRVLRLPTALYGHWLLVRYDLSVQGWGAWAWDWTKTVLIDAAVGAFIVSVLYAILRRSPRRWWCWFWAASLPIVVAGVFLAPLLVDPLYYDFRPLAETQPQLVTEIEKVVQRGGLEIPRERIFEMNASKNWKVANAYVTGIGASKRVVVWDTTTRMLDAPQTLAIFGHEMGHYVLRHIPQGIAFTAVVLFAFLFLGDRAMRWMLARWGARWSIRGPDDPASLPVLLLLAALFQFAASPAINAYSRHIEHEADVYGLEVIHGIVPDAGRADAEAQQALAEAALEDPDPPRLAVWWLYTHPTSRERIEFARRYNPWSGGEPPKFVK